MTAQTAGSISRDLCRGLRIPYFKDYNCIYVLNIVSMYSARVIPYIKGSYVLF
ncbi:hypothetical protein Hanom_Chr12g01134251 [Helianthus anomalus]